MTVCRPLTLPIEPYRSRRSRYIGTVYRGDWAIRRIGIAAGTDLPGGLEFDAALQAVGPAFPQPAVADGRTGIAFLIVHRGTEGLWAIPGWWELDILYHRVYRADLGTLAFASVPRDGPSACVWELLAIDHERRSWVTHVLSRPDAPDFDRYLAAPFDIGQARERQSSQAK